MRIRALVTFALISAFGCGSSDDEAPPASPPDGVSCSSAVGAADADGALRAAEGAQAGACVVLTGSSYVGLALSLKPGVMLVGAKGMRPKITPAEGVPGIVLADGAGLANVDVVGAPQSGIVALGAHARVKDVAVSGAKGAGLFAACAEDCAAGAIALEDVTLEKNHVGLMAVSGLVTIVRGRIAENGNDSLTSGIGLVATGGAKIDLDGTVIEKNLATGILVDGKGTAVHAKDAKVLDNGERGIWAQDVDGTLDAPSLRLESTEVARNKIVGVGALESRGIIVVGGRIADTVAAPVVTNLATTEPVGDGFGVFTGSGDVKIDGTVLEGNARAAGIIDGSDRGIIVVGGRVTAGASGLKVVIQNTTATIDIAEDLKSVPDEALGVSTTKVTVPSVGP